MGREIENGLTQTEKWTIRKKKKMTCNLGHKWHQVAELFLYQSDNKWLF